MPVTNAVITKTTSVLSTCDGATPPKKKTRLKSGIDAAISKSALARPAISFPASSENAESLEHKSRSKVCRSFSPFILVEVKAGEINTIKKSCINESRA